MDDSAYDGRIGFDIPRSRISRWSWWQSSRSPHIGHGTWETTCALEYHRSHLLLVALSAARFLQSQLDGRHGAACVRGLLAGNSHKSHGWAKLRAGSTIVQALESMAVFLVSASIICFLFNLVSSQRELDKLEIQNFTNDDRNFLGKRWEIYSVVDGLYG